MKKFISLVAVIMLVFTFTSEGLAKGFSGGSRSSGSSFKSSSSSSSFKSSTSISKSSSSSVKSSASKKSSTKVNLSKTTKPKSTTVKKKTSPVTPKKKATTSKPRAFTPPSSQLQGHQYNGRDIFIGAAGSYVIYQSINDDADCDYDDIMEGDDDCKEVTLNEEQVADLGIENGNDEVKYDNSGINAFEILLATIFSLMIVTIFVFIIVHMISMHKRKRNRKW